MRKLLFTLVALSLVSATPFDPANPTPPEAAPVVEKPPYPEYPEVVRWITKAERQEGRFDSVIRPLHPSCRWVDTRQNSVSFIIYVEGRRATGDGWMERRYYFDFSCSGIVRWLYRPETNGEPARQYVPYRRSVYPPGLRLDSDQSTSF